jgi:TRAP-type uncharacterized transport system substrate-binding protein
MYAEEGPYPRLRVIATIMAPNWLGIAIRKELGITDLSQLRDCKPALRVSSMGSWGLACERILEYHGVTRERIEAWGGRYVGGVVRTPGDPHGGLPEDRTEVDLIMGAVNAAYTFESAPFHEATMSMDLEFLPLPDDLIREICDAYGGEPGFIPYRLVRGVDRDTPSVSSPWQLVYARDDMPEDFAYLLAGAYDHQRHLFRETLMPYSYDSKTVAHDHGIPLHPGAERYYREMGYLQ